MDTERLKESLKEFLNGVTLKQVLIASATGAAICFCVLIVWLFFLNQDLKKRLSGNWFLPPIEIFSAPEPFFPGQFISNHQFKTQLKNLRYRQRQEGQKLFAKDFSFWSSEYCQSQIEEGLPDLLVGCVHIKTPEMDHGPQRDSYSFVFAFAPEDVISSKDHLHSIYTGSPLKPTSSAHLPPRLFAQFYGGKPILRRLMPIGQIPLACLQSVTAIEDKGFLDHQGVSPAGIARAAIKNLIKGRVAEGGSTITQQLVKNYFLTPERSFRRKFKELFMALLLELHVDKDKILESYLNVIYMGQNGSFQVRGFGAASEFYFGKKLEALNISECALLAAIVNSPGRYNPFRNPENAKERREKVLSHMLESQMIDDTEAKEAINEPLPNRPPKTLSEPAPYFVQAIHRELRRLNISEESGLRIFSTLNEEAQEAAQVIVYEEVNRLEEERKNLAKIKKSGNHLEASLISIDLRNNSIIALVGGRKFKKTQYNRILDAHRQVGSIMKPFVYLAAIESVDTEGNPYTPLTPILDEKLEYKYEGQVWSPKNYENDYHGSIPLFYGLKNSLNVATARLGLEVGLSGVIDVAKRSGVVSEMKNFPSLTLGAFELFPWEVAQAFSSIARMGKKTDTFYITSVEDIGGSEIYRNESEESQVIAPENASVLVGMMKQTILTGTGRSIPLWRGFTHPAAGKTGTTSDTKDAWFVGFTPYILTVTWVGYDDNTPHELTGSSGAVPIWAKYMKSFASKYPVKDFDWAKGTTIYDLPAVELGDMLVKPKPHEVEKATELVFRSGTEPSF